MIVLWIVFTFVLSMAMSPTSIFANILRVVLCILVPYSWILVLLSMYILCKDDGYIAGRKNIYMKR